MLMSNHISQAAYFNHKAHQFDPSSILTPPTHNLLELNRLLALASPKKTDHIADFGAGSGRLTLFLLQKGFNVTAVDISTQSLQTLRSHYQTHQKPSWGTLKTSTTLPLNLDLIVGTDILHHTDLPVTLPALHRHLKPTGRLAFSEPNGLNPLWYLFLVFQRLPWHIEKNLVHTTSFNLSRQFRRAGFTQLSIQGHGLLPTPLWPSPSNVTLGNLPLLRHLAFRLIVGAQKPA